VSARLATLDVGTNSILLLVAELGADGELHAVDDRCRIERLGRGVDESGQLDPEKIRGALDAMREYAEAIRAAGATTVAAVGTQALREATNAREFLDPAAEILGVPVEVIGGEREADLSYLAAARSFPGLGEMIVMDVGGGSTELIVGRGAKRERAVSVPIGSVRLHERHGDNRAALALAVDEALAAVELPSAVPLVGIAGTVTTLAAVALGLSAYDPDRVHGHRVTRAEVERQVALYLTTPMARRGQIVGLDPKRADVIGAGAVLVERVMARVGADELLVSDRGVRWGLAYERQQDLAGG
jgi:exopolyphosphatase / guanosine-5'-triphosphate,3'-diphosphate pyrophosphatase